MDVHIGEIQTRITVADDASTLLSPEVLQKIVKTVMEHLKQQQDSAQQRENDVRVDDRVYRKKGL